MHLSIFCPGGGVRQWWDFYGYPLPRGGDFAICLPKGGDFDHCGTLTFNHKFAQSGGLTTMELLAYIYYSSFWTIFVGACWIMIVNPSLLIILNPIEYINNKLLSSMNDQIYLPET